MSEENIIKLLNANFNHIKSELKNLRRETQENNELLKNNQQRIYELEKEQIKCPVYTLQQEQKKIKKTTNRAKFWLNVGQLVFSVATISLVALILEFLDKINIFK